jgi:ribosomal protein S27E
MTEEEPFKPSKPIGICCAACGNTDLFAHDSFKLTCNRCGHTFETDTPVTTIVEQVVLKYNDSQ